QLSDWRRQQLAALGAGQDRLPRSCVPVQAEEALDVSAVSLILGPLEPSPTIPLPTLAPRLPAFWSVTADLCINGLLVAAALSLFLSARHDWAALLLAICLSAFLLWGWLSRLVRRLRSRLRERPQTIVADTDGVTWTARHGRQRVMS